MSVVVREATIADIPSILSLGKLMHEESIFASFDFDVGKVVGLVETLVQVRRGIALVAEAEGRVVGGFLGVVTEHYFGNDLQASDYALFIDPQYRKGSTALRLIRAYIEAALHKGAKQVMLANSTGYEQERVAALFESQGFVKRGYVFEWGGA